MSNEQRDRFIAAKLNEGHSLSDVQKMLQSELGIVMTYLDLRLAAAEIESVDWEAQEPEPPANDPAEAVGEAVPSEPASEPAAEDKALGSGQTRVTVSKLVRPGAAMSGEVEFGSGARGEWYIDAYGRPGLSLAEGSAQPTQDDVVEFQEALRQKLSGGA